MIKHLFYLRTGLLDANNRKRNLHFEEQKSIWFHLYVSNSMSDNTLHNQFSVLLKLAWQGFLLQSFPHLQMFENQFWATWAIEPEPGRSEAPAGWDEMQWSASSRGRWTAWAACPSTGCARGRRGTWTRGPGCRCSTRPTPPSASQGRGSACARSACGTASHSAPHNHDSLDHQTFEQQL